MRSVLAMSAVVLILSSVLHGLHGFRFVHHESVNATVGQNISLPCVIIETSVHISQIEWKKQEGKNERKLLVYNPNFDLEIMSPNVTLQVNTEEDLRGSHLLLREVELWDAGRYMCEITTFPNGSIRKVTRLRIKDLSVSATVDGPDRALREGDNVNILCFSNPTAQSYSLWPSKNESSVQKSKDGEFRLENVTRNSSGPYICQAEWLLSTHLARKRSTFVHLTVNYLDGVECDASSPIRATEGHNVTLRCWALTSSTTRYLWTRADENISESGSLMLKSMSRGQSGVYTLTVTVDDDPGLRQHVNFSVEVVTGPDRDSLTTPPSALQPTTEWSSPHVTQDLPTSTGTMDALATMTTSTSIPTSGSNSTANNFTVASVPWLSKVNGSTGSPNPIEEGLNGSSTLDYSANKSRLGSKINSTVQPDFHTLYEGQGTDVARGTQHTWTHPQNSSDTMATRLRPRGIDMTESAVSQMPTSQASSLSTHSVTNRNKQVHRYIVFLIVLFLVLFVLIGCLYRRKVIQRRMKMPPPFKPPPPPAKYTSLQTREPKNRDIAMSNILN